MDPSLKVQYIDLLTKKFDKFFVEKGYQVEGDLCIQIGTVFMRFGEDKPYLKHLITLKGCAPIDGVEVESYENEEEVLEAWARVIKRENPTYYYWL